MRAADPAVMVTTPDADEAAPGGASRARELTVRRLVDVVCLPGTRVSPQERHMAGDVLVELLRDAPVSIRQRCAERMVSVVDAPKIILRLLARDDIEVARGLIENAKGLDDSDLIATVRHGSAAHRLAIAMRRNLSETVADALLERGEVATIEALLRNKTASISSPGLEVIVAASREWPRLLPLMLRREELKPSQALAAFWWADFEDRRLILRRFAVERVALLDAVGDLFHAAAAERWQDAPARKALQFIERRQRNRAASERSRFGSLESAVAAAERVGMTRELVIEISHLSGLKPATGAKLFTDAGGEGIAVLCKATGLKRSAVLSLWVSLKRPVPEDTEDPSSALGRTFYVFDILSASKAQTVLRYWNWSLTSAPPLALSAIGGADEGDDDGLEFSPARRAAQLVFGRPAEDA
jgi:uncharacterized protein (DUF2336 family)